VSAAISDSSPPGQFYCPTCEKNFEVGDRCPSDGTRLVKINVPLDPLLGRELDGRYQIVQKLGQGGMGAVYRGQQLGLGREVAIKVVSAHLVAETEVVKRFLREAKLASRLSHPNAVAVLDFNQSEDGLFYLVMELVSGNTLDKVLETDKIMKPERIVRIGAQICDALEGAHALSIVHRDLKPSNIMLLSRGRDLVKVLDFGLAKSVAPDQQNTTMTNAGALLGTPAFMCPELALGQPCDGRADQYSLGVVLYLMGTGQLPFISESAHELIAMHATDDAPPMTGVPRALGAVVDRMLRKNPDDRYASAAEAREALEAALESSKLQTPAAGVAVFQSSPGQLVAVPNAMTPLNARDVGIAVSDTMAQIGSVRAGKPRRWIIPAVIVAVVGIGGGVYMAMRDGPPAKPDVTVPITLPATPMQETPPPPPQPPPIKLEAASDVGNANAPDLAVKPTKTHKVPGSVKQHGVDKTVAHPPPVEDVKPPVVETKPQPKPGQGSGSGLPF
jgi:eukaryotic-like serine/threonine-protein kinase